MERNDLSVDSVNNSLENLKLKKLRQELFLALLKLWLVSTKKKSETDKAEQIDDIKRKSRLLEQIILYKSSQCKQMTVPIHAVIIMNGNIRRASDEHSLKKIRCSIEKFGLKNPLIVRKVEDKFLIVNGFLRYIACKELKLTKIPVLIKDFSNKEATELGYLDTLSNSEWENEESELLTTIMEFYNQMVN